MSAWFIVGISAIGLLVTLGGLVAKVTWNLSGAIQSFERSVNHLDRTVSKLDRSVITMGEKLADHETRISLLEQKRKAG